MKTARCHRLFNPKSGRCFDVLVDHVFLDEVLAGIENVAQTIATLGEPAPETAT